MTYHQVRWLVRWLAVSGMFAIVSKGVIGQTGDMAHLLRHRNTVQSATGHLVT
jgi:hypothetical protein